MDDMNDKKRTKSVFYGSCQGGSSDPEPPPQRPTGIRAGPGAPFLYLHGFYPLPLAQVRAPPCHEVTAVVSLFAGWLLLPPVGVLRRLSCTPCDALVCHRCSCHCPICSAPVTKGTLEVSRLEGGGTHVLHCGFPEGNQLRGLRAMRRRIKQQHLGKPEASWPGPATPRHDNLPTPYHATLHVHL